MLVGGFILFDIFTGFLKALYHEGINSTKLRQGLFHKLSEVLTVAGAIMLQIGTVNFDLGFTLPLVKPVVTYICVMELVSIIENLCVVNPALEKLFKPYLQKLKESEQSNNENI